MHNLQWDVKIFQELLVSQFFDVLQLRVNVFVVEQQCAYPELDEHDRHAETRHLAGRDASGQLIAYARILPAAFAYWTPTSSCTLNKEHHPKHSDSYIA